MKIIPCNRKQTSPSVNVSTTGSFRFVCLVFLNLSAVVFTHSMELSSLEEINARAELAMAELLLKGNGVEQNYPKARGLLQQVFEQDVHLYSKASACLHLAKMFYLGQGVIKNDLNVAYYLQKFDEVARKIYFYEPMSRLYAIKEQLLLLLQFKKDNASFLDEHEVNFLSSIQLKAVEYGYLELVETLLADGLTFNTVDSQGRSPLHYCAMQYEDHVEICKLLVAHGIPVNGVDEFRKTALHCAAFNGSCEVIEVLIDLGAQVNSCDDRGRTPLHCFLERYRPSGFNESDSRVIELLLERGADIHARDLFGSTPLHVAAENYSPGLALVLNTLIMRGADLTALDNNGGTVLHSLAKKHDPRGLNYFTGHEDALRLFIERGVNVSSVDRLGRSALYYVQDREIAEILQAAGNAAHDSASGLGTTHLQTVSSASTSAAEPA